MRSGWNSILILLADSQHNLYDIYLLLCIQYWTPDDGQKTCWKHVEFYSKNKSEKLVHLVGFIIRMFPKAWAASDWKLADHSRLPMKRQPCWHNEMCPAISSYCDWSFPWFPAVASHVPGHKLKRGSSLHPTNQRDLSQRDCHHAPPPRSQCF